jgi:hypothetical protein
MKNRPGTGQSKGHLMSRPQKKVTQGDPEEPSDNRGEYHHKYAERIAKCVRAIYKARPKDDNGYVQPVLLADIKAKMQARGWWNPEIRFGDVIGLAEGVTEVVDHYRMAFVPVGRAKDIRDMEWVNSRPQV